MIKKESLRSKQPKISIMKLKANVAVSETGFLFDPNTGESFSLNKTGQFILKLLKDNKDEAEVLEAVMEKYEVDPAVFQRYMDDFVRMLEQFNLLEREDQ